MFKLDADTREILEALVNRPAWKGEPTVLVFRREEDARATEEWWRETVGDGPTFDPRNVRVGPPEPTPTISGGWRVRGESEFEPADLIFVDARHPEIASFWKRFGDAPVVELEVA